MGRVRSLSASPEFSLRLEKYELLEEIGHGGMATVYRARDKRLGREVAVKIIHRHLRENREVAQRFQSEARAYAKLKHPNIVEVYDVSDAGEDERYLVVELVRGTTLRKLLADEGYLPAEVAAAIAVELADALDHAHRLGVIHRDIKPENVLIGEARELGPEQPAPVLVKITDFGIAKLLDAQGVTSTGQVLGSPAHMAPEQIEGGEVTARSDVFGLGVLLYECMVGRLPFDGKNPAQVLRRVLDGAFTPAERARPTIGAGYSAILERALAHKSEQRFPSLAELAAALRQELTALGFDSPRAELHAFLTDPAGYRAEHEQRAVQQLVLRAARARDRREFPAAAACYNRALAYRPDDPELLTSVSTLLRGERLRQSARRFGAAAGAAIVLGAGAVALVRAVVVPAPTPASSANTQLPPRPSAARAAVPKPAVSVPSAASAASASEIPQPRRPSVPRVGWQVRAPDPPIASQGVARVRVLVDGPQSATVKIDGVEMPWFGKIQELVPGEHTFEFQPPDELCCETGQTLRLSIPASQGPDDIQTVRGRIEFRPATLQLRGTPGSTASCGALGQFPVPSEQLIPMTSGAKSLQCSVFPPEGSADPPKQFDVTLTPGRTSTNLGQ